MPGSYRICPRAEARLALDRLTRGLTRRQRQVWALVDVAGRSAGGAGLALELPAATIRSHRRHARAALTLTRAAQELRLS